MVLNRLNMIGGFIQILNRFKLVANQLLVLGREF